MLKRIFKWIGLGLLGLILIALLVYAFLPKGPRDPMPYTDLAKTEKQLIQADRFAVVAGTPWASQAGYDVLARGGNACDAAVATLLTLNVTHGEAASFPGVAPTMYYNARTGEVKSYIGAGKAPAAATIEKFKERGFKTVPEMTLWSQLVPASPDVIIGLLTDCGTMSFGELAQLAVKVARQGFPAHAILVRNLDFSLGLLPGRENWVHDPDAGELQGVHPRRTPSRLASLGVLCASWVMFFGCRDSYLVGAEGVDERPLPLRLERAFPDLRLRRPVILAHAGDSRDRLFVGSQQGVIHVVPNRQDVTETATFLDIESRVVYSDAENEEGMLGLAFHPKFRENGQFLVYYTTRDAPHTSVISRFHVSADDPNRADPASEEEILRIPQPYWNHNGGTLAFGPDGYLYIGLGDGGKFNDPHMNGQNVQTLLGSILRIDVDRQDAGLKYAIPADNPFAAEPRYARGEIFAFGFRNVWRLSFDRQTGALWAADVGQDTWEEIDIVRAGGNYGAAARK